MERIGLGIDVQADSSQAVKGFNELNKAIDAVKNNSKGLNAANDPFSLAQLERKKERLPSFIQDFGKRTGMIRFLIFLMPEDSQI